MKLLDYVILGVIIIWCGLVLLHMLRVRKRGGCVGCSGCAAGEKKSCCHRNESGGKD